MKAKLCTLIAGMVLASVGTGLGQQPTITNQPLSQAVAVGATATFSVGAIGAEPLSYQWQQAFDFFTFVDRPEGTNSTLVITNVQTPDSGYYRVVITNFNGAIASSLALLTVVVPPRIVTQPTDFPVLSIGACLTNRVVANSQTPMGYQWRLNGTDLPGQTRNSIIFTNLQMPEEGKYDVVVANLAGSVTSRVVTLKVDPTFTKITKGVIVTDSEGSVSGNWADYDNDGFVDLFVANSIGSGAVRNALYHNEHGTNFTRVATGPVANDLMRAWASAWGDYDNDGNIDLIVANLEGGLLAQRLYRNNGNGIFTGVVDSALRSDTSRAITPWWFDYNADGFLDLLVTKGIYFDAVANDCLFRNNGNGTFRKMTIAEVGPMLNDRLRTETGFSIDYDNDGRQEVFILHGIPLGGGLYDSTNFTWRPQADGTFASVSVLPKVAAMQYWADYDNDGWQDVLGMDLDNRLHLFRNLGAGGFADVSPALNVVTTNRMFGAAWGDYDNDGWLDLYYTAPGDNIMSGLFRNNGDGTFTQVLTGSPVQDRDRRCAPSWADYDNDGFLDLFVAVGNAIPAKNALYRNNGNPNHHLKVKLDGRASNRSGIGARVHINATIGGRNFWQMRELSCGNSYHAQNGLLAHFGLGDATLVTTLRIEWPSGIVQRLYSVAADQFLTITETTNTPPVAAIAVSPLAEFPGVTNLIVISPNGATAEVVFDGSRSHDLDNDPLEYSWLLGTNVFATDAVVKTVLGLGSHTVTLVVNDGLATGTSSATLEVVTAAESVGIVMAMVQSSGLPRSRQQPLMATLQAAAASFERGSLVAGLNQLHAFQNKVRAQVASPVLAGQLTEASQVIIDAL